LNELAILLKAQFFTATESDKLRRAAVSKLRLSIEELWASRKDESMASRAKTYIAIGLLARVMDAIVTNAEVAEIHGRLEEAEAAVSEVEATRQSGKKVRAPKASPYG